jgi:hypothetical protein
VLIGYDLAAAFFEFYAIIFEICPEFEALPLPDILVSSKSSEV